MLVHRGYIYNIYIHINGVLSILYEIIYCLFKYKTHMCQSSTNAVIALVNQRGNATALFSHVMCVAGDAAAVDYAK